MIKYTVNLKKMNTLLDNNYAQYHLEHIDMNQLLGKKISVVFLNKINCICCGRLIKKSFKQGYCFPCAHSLPECDICIMRPELCHFYNGTCRDSIWGNEHCIKPHLVYLANTSKVKVGITREKNMLSRWIDQGASQALPIIRVAERLLSGIIEVKLKGYLPDRTNWQLMLKGYPNFTDLSIIREKVLQKESNFIKDLRASYGIKGVEIAHSNPINIYYPVLTYPKKIILHNLDKHPIVEGTLLGIKGQFLILDSGLINIRKFSGYRCNLTVN